MRVPFQVLLQFGPLFLAAYIGYERKTRSKPVVKRKTEKTVSQAKSFHVFMTLDLITKHSHCTDDENSYPNTLHSCEMCLALSF